MKNLKNFIFWTGIFITILTFILIKPLSNLDEIWNFNIARCIANGLIPYKDISMVTTPLLGFITALALKLFGAEMFVTRIIAAILAIINLLLVYRICIKLQISKTISNILIIGLTFIFKDYFCLDYNFFLLFIGLLIILFEIKNQQNSSIRLNIFIGLLGGLAICCKQTVGSLIAIVIVLNQVFFIKNKSNVKKILKIILFRTIGICIPIIIFTIYLVCTNSYIEFWDYCIMGLKTFSNKIPYMSIIKSDDIIIKILGICAPVILLITLILNIIDRCLSKENKILYLLNIYCLPIFSLVYPISDNIHFFIAIIPIFILSLYVLSNKLKKIKRLNLNYLYDLLNTICLLCVIVFTLHVELINSEKLGDLSKYTNINHFKYIEISNDENNSIVEMSEFLNSSEEKVYILDASAALYMIPIERYNKNYDMFNKGNFGGRGEEGQIEQIKNEDAKYLILNDAYYRNWQNPEEVRAYIKDNLNFTGTIGIYDIYEKYEQKLK